MLYDGEVKVLRFIFRNLDHFRWLFVLVAIASLINGAATFFVPVTLAQFADNDITMQAAIWTISVVAGLYLVSLIASYIVRDRGEALAYMFSNHIRLKYFRQLSVLTVSQLRKHHSGYIQSLVNKVSDDLSQTLFSMFWDLIPGVQLVILFFVYIARESLGLAVFNLAVLLVFLVVSTILSRKIVPLAAEQNRRRASVMGGFADFMANISTVSQLGIQSYTHSVLTERVKHNDKQIQKTQRFHARRWFVLHGLYGLAYLSTIAFLVWQIQSGQAGLGLLILFVSAYSMLKSLIARLFENIKQFIEVGAYISELEDMQAGGAQQGGKAISQWNKFTLRDIALKYDGSAATIRIPQFTIKRGDKICIEGKSGQGKSTLLGILTNTIAPQGGKRMIDNIHYDELDRSFFVENVATIAQEAELFHMSVRDNLVLGKEISDKRLLKYLEDIGTAEWLQSLENGLDSKIGEKGVTMSAGQRQRLNILRAVILDRPIYILDEPTSHLDENTERTVIDFLRRELGDKTLIIVTHRPAMRELCDHFFEMKMHSLSAKK